MPTPKIELSYNKVPMAGDLFNIGHGFVIYTDKDSKEFALRAGPETSSIKKLGKLKMTAEPYQEGHPDFGKFDRILLYEGNDADKKYQAAKLFANQENKKFRYRALYQNCHTFSYIVLDIMELAEIAENILPTYSCGLTNKVLCRRPGFGYNGYQLFRGSIDLQKYRKAAGIPPLTASVTKGNYPLNKSYPPSWNSILNSFDSPSKPHENIEQKFTAFEKRGELKKQKSNKFYENMVVELPDGSRTTVRELIEIPRDGFIDGPGISVEKAIEELLELKLEELNKGQEKEHIERFKTFIGYAQAATMFGVLTNNSTVQKLGISAESVLNISFFLRGAFTGDPVAIINLLSSVSNLKNLFHKKNSVDPNAMILNSLQYISSQLNDLKLQINQGFTELDDHINHLFETMCEGFQSIHLEIYISRYLTFEKLDRLQDTMHQLSLQMNRQIYDLWLRDLIDARFALMNYQTRYQQLKQIPDSHNTFENLSNIATIFVNWFTNKSGHYNSTGVHLYYKGCSPDKILAVLKNSDPEDIIGFLSSYLRYDYKYLTSALSHSTSNPNIWILASSAFMALITETDTDYFYNRYDPYHNIYKQLLLSAHEILTIYDSIRRNIGLFSLLLYRYQQIIEHSIQESFGELLRIKSLQVQEATSEERLKEEESKIILRSQHFNVQCAFNLSVDKHEPAYSQLVNKLNHWNNVIAKNVVPSFFLQYQNFLEKECNTQRISSSPLELFFITEDNFLLPTSILFSVYPNLSIPLELPSSLLLAERLRIGKFVFKIPTIDFIQVGGKYEEESDLKFLNLTFTVSITFEYLNQTMQIATVILRSDPSDHHPAVAQIRSTLPIQSKYGKEFGNDFYSGIVNTLRKVTRLSGWLNAKVESFTINFDSECQLAKQVELEINKKSLIAIKDIAIDLNHRIPRSQPNDAKRLSGERYVETFSKLLHHLDNLDVNYYLLLSFAKLAGFSGDTIGKLKRMWDSQYIILLCKKIIDDTEILRTAQSSALTILSNITTFKNWIKIHFTEWDDHTNESPHKIFPVGGVGFLEVAECLREELQLARDKPHLTHNSSHLVVLECLSHLKDTKTLTQLKIKIDKQWIQENLPLMQGLSPTEAFSAHLTKASIQYTGEEIRSLLTCVCEPIVKDVNLEIMPPYLLNHELLSDDSEDSPIFLRCLFEKNIEQVLKTYQKTGVRLILPICLNHSTDNSNDNLWITVIAVYDAARGRKNAVIFMIDPTGNNQLIDADAVDPLNPYQEVDALKKTLIASVMTAFSKAAIPLKRFFISGLKQIGPDQIKESAPILIANVQAIMRQQPLNPKILDNVAVLIQEQHQFLKNIKKIEVKRADLEEKISPLLMGLLPTDGNNFSSVLSSDAYDKEGLISPQKEEKAIFSVVSTVEDRSNTPNNLIKTNFSRPLFNKKSAATLVGASIGFFATGGMMGVVVGAAAGLGGKQIVKTMTSACSKKNNSSIPNQPQ